MDIDTNWINDYENEEKTYSFFYEEPIETLKYTILYVNKNKKIDSIIQDNISLNETNKITKEELITLIKKYQKNITNEKKYKLISMLLYTFPLQHIELSKFIKNDDNDVNINNFPLKNINYINDIILEPTILFFHSINNIYIIFHEKIEGSNIQTKKVIMHTNKKTKKNKK
tara:strand:+ start:3210 stop:3722 length:513 start_codon:yes stop_codon:yes gene_type:complete